MVLFNKVSGWLLQTVFFGLLGGFSQPACSADDLRVLMVLSDSSPLYQNFAMTFEQNLPSNIRLNLVQRAEDFDAQQADLIVAVGVRAAYRAAEKTALPLLATMIPSNIYANLQGPRHGQTSAIYLDQSWARQAALLSAVMPERQKIGVLYSAPQDMSMLRGELAVHHATLIARHLRSKDTLFSDLDELLIDSDVLLAVPDSEIYNSNSIRNILLSSYRRGIPLVGFSQAYVKAGALCAIFSTPEQLAAQAAAMTVSFFRTGKLPDAQFPAKYSIAVNQEVARTLGLTLQSGEALLLQVEKSSGGSR